MEIVIDGGSIGDEMDFHRAVARQVDLGEYYGWNLAALRDRFEVDVPRPVRLVWRNSEISRQNLGAETFSRIQRVLEEVVDQDLSFGWDERFEFVLE